MGNCRQEMPRTMNQQVELQTTVVARQPKAFAIQHQEKKGNVVARNGTCRRPIHAHKASLKCRVLPQDDIIAREYSR